MLILRKNSIELEFTKEELINTELSLIVREIFLSNKINITEAVKDTKITNNIKSDDVSKDINNTNEYLNEDDIRIRDIQSKYNPKLVSEHFDLTKGELVSPGSLKQNTNVKTCRDLRCINCGQATIFELIEFNDNKTKHHYILRQTYKDKIILVELDYERTSKLIENIKFELDYKNTINEVRENDIVNMLLKAFIDDNTYLIESDIVIRYIEDDSHMTYIRCPLCFKEFTMEEFYNHTSDIDYDQCDFCGSELYVNVNDNGFVCSNKECTSNRIL